ncbi:N utilization substance protein B [Symbiobacterium terraclitae]|uniref:Transcription antitermination protein NusB n=1 Tax=Symbiobacterium terraclitae TaxID=557451 RepID=A0ABS4JNX7_9FIRM|nr:N utilization substance protein B [Symbiobacterium terraclitae]
MSRRKARELALQALFQMDMAGTDPETAVAQALTRDVEPDWSPGRLDGDDAEFARRLAQGAWAAREESDRLIARYAKDWSVERMAGVDRAILRMAVYEIAHLPEVPDSVAVAEAVELAKAFSTADSSRFINGILGSVIRGMKGAASADEALSRD